MFVVLAELEVFSREREALQDGNYFSVFTGNCPGLHLFEVCSNPGRVQPAERSTESERYSGSDGGGDQNQVSKLKQITILVLTK